MSVAIHHGNCLDVLATLPEQSAHCCVTSPPYWGLRDYGVDGQLGLESTPEEYVANMVAVFREVRRVLRDDGTLWLNIGDSYSGGKTGRSDDGSGDPTSRLGPKRNGCPNNTGMGPVSTRHVPAGFKPKDLVGIPWRVAFALQADGWYLRQDIIWHKPNPMPESVTDRCTKAHEYVFLLAKSDRYYYDTEAIKEAVKSRPAARNKAAEGWYAGCGNSQCQQGERVWGNQSRNRRSVWTVPTHPYSVAHFAMFPPDLIRPMILAGCPVGGTVLDPFGGSGTTGMVAEEEGRNSVLIELNPEYVVLAHVRTKQMGLFCGVGTK